MSESTVNVERLSPKKRALYELLLKKQKQQESDGVARAQIRRREEESDSLPLSFAQQRLWFVDQLEPGNPTYNCPVAVRLSGELDVAALERTLAEVVRRHETLRTTFAAADGEPVQKVAAAGALSLPVVDLAGLPADEKEERAHQLAAEEARRPFDLAEGPLLRATLLRLGEREHIALFTMHHIVSDFWSMGVLVREVGTLYAAFTKGEPSPLPELPVQYADYAVWQRRLLSGETLKGEVEYWRGQLAGAPQVLELPTDRPRPAVQTFNGTVETWVLPEELTQDLRALARREGTTLYMTLLAAFNVLLSRYTGQSDIVVGSPIAGRDRAETEDLIGFFINTLVLRTRLDGDPTFRELLGRVRETTLSAYAHQTLPFEKLVEELNPERSLSHTPLYQVTFGLQNINRGVLELPGLTLSQVGVEGKTARAEITLNILEAEQTLVGNLQYNTDLFDAETVRRMIRHYEHLLRAVVLDPARRVSGLPLMDAEEERLMLFAWNDTRAPYADGACIHELFEGQAARTPEAVAVFDETVRLSYRELDERANRLARYLRSLGVGPETRVGLSMNRSAGMVTAVLAILKAGGAYVPLDPSYPDERLAFMTDDAMIAVLLTEERHLDSAFAQQVVCLDSDEELIAAQSAEPLPNRVGADNLAYVIYTSGSTGRPKGVLVPHRGLCNLSEAQRAAFGVREGDNVLQFASLNFDASIFEIVMALAKGATLHLGGAEVLSGNSLVALLRERGITNLTIPPSVLATAEAEELPSLRTVIVAGEACPAELVARWVPGRQFFNAYGPTEATVWATAAGCDDGGRKPNIGRPIANTRVHLLDARLQPVPVGVAGELHIGGVGLARGYHNRPDLTAERFIPDPFSTEPGARLYKTGDVARYLSGGEIEFLSRLDEQVKVRGFRIELGEIESALARHDAVEQAVAVVREDTPGDKRIVAYVTTSGAAAPAPGELRSFVKERLPEYMVPSDFVLLERMPSTPNGKLDRRALPAPDEARQPEAADEYAAPRSPVEEVLAGIWSDVLKRGPVGIHANFFDLGGHSLLATQLVSRVRELLGAEVPLRHVFEAPTVAAFAPIVEAAARAGHGLDAPAVLPVARGGQLPLSFAQQRLWFVDQLEGGQSAYNIPVAMRLRGRLDVDALERTLSEIGRRHEVLRTSFPVIDGQPVQAIAPPRPLALPVVDLSALPDGERREEARRLAHQEARTPFDLLQGPLLRVSLLRLSEEEHVLLFTMHHIISDGWSMGVLMKEVSALYRAFSAGEESPLAELSVQYADFAVWQREWLRGEVLEKQLDYWRGQLAGAPPVLDLPADRPRPVVQSFNGALESVALPESLTAALRELARREGVTLFMALVAGFKSLLHYYTGVGDVVVGTDVANRNRAETEGLIGFFINQLVLRTDLSGNPSFRELLGRVRETTLGAYAHQDLPFDKLVETLNPGRDLSRTPLFQVKIILQNAPREVLEVPGLEMSRVAQEAGFSRYDLALHLTDCGDALGGTAEYNTDLFDASTIRRMLRHFRTLLEEAVARPELALTQLALLGEDERRELLEDWNRTEADYPRDLCVHELFERQAALAPDSSAVICGGQELSYGELDARSNQLARYLRGMGVGPEVRVGVCLPRSSELVVALLAVMKAGGVYVPLDSSYPLERLAVMLEDAQSPVLVTDEERLDSLPSQWGQVVCVDSDWDAVARESREAVEGVRLSEDNLAYVIYTSGSTGMPKGVAVTHRGLSNLVAWHQSAYSLTPSDRSSLVAGVGFDASAWELWPALASGCSLAIPPREVLLSEGLLSWLCGEGVTVCFLPTPLAESALASPLGDVGRLRAVLTGGDRLRRVPDVSPGFSLINHYGPTEATVVATCTEVEFGAEVAPPIGRPISNTRAYVLDAGMRPVPVGVSGELYVGGDGLARGYLSRPSLTAERFVPDPFGGEGGRLYKTGDVVRYLPDGEIEFIGRADYQVKVRGFRIELGEIEAALQSHSGVRECVVVARESSDGDTRLVAYAVAEDADAAPTTDELRAHLKERLPESMVPSAFVTMEALPLTPNGKVDRQNLPEPGKVNEEPSGEAEGGRTPVEELLAGMWAQLLGAESVGVNKNFFELGGHSLLATHLVSKIKEAFQVELPLRIVFEAPTVAALAEAVEAARLEAAGLRIPPIEPVPRDAALPLSSAQQRLWFMDQLEPGSAAYNSPCVMRLKGELNVAALEAALGEVYRRHEVLRTFYPTVDGHPVQAINPPEPLRLNVTDISALPDAEREAEAHRLTVEEARRPFDLARGPVLRVGLLKLADDEHITHFMMHHIIADAWSLGVLVREVGTLYDAFSKGEQSPLPEMRIQYADFAHWQQTRLQGEVLETELRYWKRQLGGELPTLELPTDRPRPVVPSQQGARFPFVLSGDLASAVRRLSRQEAVTPFMTLLAAFCTLLHHYTKQRDIIVGTAHANRSHAGTEGLIGFFVNMLAMRTDLSGHPTFRELLARVRETTLGAFAHQDVPFEKLVEELQCKRQLGQTPIFQVAFGVENARQQAYSAHDPEPVSVHDLTMSPVSFDLEVVRYDLTLWVREGRDRMGGWWNYRTSLFDPSTIERMHGHFEALLRNIVERPDAPLDQLEMFTAVEREEQVARQKSLEESKHKRLMKIKPQAIRAAASDAGDAA